MNLTFFYGFPMVFLWSSYDFPMVVLWFFHQVMLPMISSYGLSETLHNQAESGDAQCVAVSFSRRVSMAAGLAGVGVGKSKFMVVSVELMVVSWGFFIGYNHC